VVSLAGVVDLALAEELGLGGHAAAALLAGSPDERPERYAQADPARLLPTGVRTVLVQGLDDDVVPPAVSRSFAAAAAGAGDDVALHELEGVDHDGVIDPTSTAWPAVLSAVAEALR
jgi:pimeloyl-ACP methyl ester carboxylesterase